MARRSDVSSGKTEVELAYEACRSSFLTIFGLSFFINLLALTMPLYLLQIYDHVLSSRSVETLVLLTGIVVLALAVYASLDGLRRGMLARIGAWLDERLQSSVLTAAVQAAKSNNPTAATQAWRDLANMRSFFGGGAVATLFDTPWTPIFIAAMFIIDPLLGWIGVCGSLVLFLFALANDFATRGSLKRATTAWARSQHRLQALLGNVDAITSMGMLDGGAQQLREDHSDARHEHLAASTTASTIQAVSRFVRLSTQVLVMATAAWLVISQGLSPAAIFACSILLSRALGPVENAIGTWRSVSAIRFGYRRLKDLTKPQTRVSTSGSLPSPQGALSIEKVSFVPPCGGRPVLRRINCSLGAGEVLGIVGPSGAGKSTLGCLIAGTIKPSVGHVRMDGCDVSHWLNAGGHEHFGFLPQDIQLFDGSVAANIARLQHANADETVAAAKLFGLHETIMRMPRGYDTEIGEGGVRLSGGERQRLGLARAFFGRPRLVVLDEPNSCLDPAGEKALRLAIKEMQALGTTIVIIAQRLGILSVADKMMLLNGGVIRAFGTRCQVVEMIRNANIGVSVGKLLKHQAQDASVKESSQEPIPWSTVKPAKQANVTPFAPKLQLGPTHWSYELSEGQPVRK